MNDENKIGDAKLEEAEAVIEELEAQDTDMQDSDMQDTEPATKPVKIRKRFGLAVLLAATFISSTLGAGVIWLSTQYNKTSIPNLLPMQTQIESIDTEAASMAAETKALKAQISRLQREIKNKSATPAAVDMTPIVARLKALEEAVTTEIDPELVTRLEALQTNGSGALDLTDIMARLDALESRPPVSAAPTPNLSEGGSDAPDLSDIIARLQALESRPEMTARSAPSLNIAEPVILFKDPVEFPTKAVLASLPKPEGWLERSLKKHISVQSDDNPRYLVEVINKNLSDGNVDAAIAAFDKLPAEAKVTAQDWRESLNP